MCDFLRSNSSVLLLILTPRLTLVEQMHAKIALRVYKVVPHDLVNVYCFVCSNSLDLHLVLHYLREREQSRRYLRTRTAVLVYT